MSADRRSGRAAAVAMGAVFAIAGCGGGGSGSASGPGGQLSLKADPSGQLKFDRKTLASKPGKLTITMSNPAPLSHNVSLEGPGIATQMGQTVTQGGTSRVSATLKPGTYTFFCSVPGHREAGMVGTLTVK